VGQRNDLREFAYLPHELPDYLTRARTLVACAAGDAPAVFLDTGPAAALGALQDPLVGGFDEQLVLNLGNMHALAFHLRGTQIISLYEHHTGEMTAPQIEDFTDRLLTGDLPHEDVFSSKGHGVYYADPSCHPERQVLPRKDASEGSRRSAAAQRHSPPLIAVTGPQRGKLRGSRLNPYFAVPHGDMMVSGCFGLLWAYAEKHDNARNEILGGLGIAAEKLTA
jgi:uncharacterized protein (DUF1786 family)